MANPSLTHKVMNNLKQLLKRPLRALPTKLAVFLLIVALLGFADATYLTVEHYKGSIPPCTVVEGCETVLTSEYSVVAGVPVSLAGAIFYFLILVGVFSFIESKKTSLLKWALILTVIGFLMTLWFTYLQAFVIGAFCLYCLGSALTSTVLFVTAIVIFKKYLDRGDATQQS
jgi:uncharacterized membrane protein